MVFMSVSKGFAVNVGSDYCRLIFAVDTRVRVPGGRHSLWVTYLQDTSFLKCLCGCKVLGTLLRFICPVWECIVWKCAVHRVVHFGLLRRGAGGVGSPQSQYSDSREISSAKMCISLSITEVKYLYMYFIEH